MRRAFDANWVVIRTESGRGVPRPEHLALVPVPGRGDLAQPLPPGKGTGGVPLAVPSRLPRSRANVCWTTASPFGYTEGVGYAVTKSATFLRWLKELRDKRARARIAIRIDRVQEGNFGDHKAVGGGVSELRIPVGQGYRVYYTIREGTVVVLLCGGDKSSQPQDIRRAQRMAIEV